MIVICNKEYKCPEKHKANCIHAKPHRGRGGGCEKGIGGEHCQSVCDPAGIMSKCVQVNRKGEYEVTETKWCTCDKCGDNHSHHKTMIKKYRKKK